MDHQPSTPLERQEFVCYMCCDRVSADETITLKSCNHRGCNVCTAKWIKKQEDSGQLTSPTCPICRSNIHDWEALAVLGRPFQQRVALARTDNDEIDDLTLQWLNDQTALCPGCGSRVEKVDGCNHMTCLCGCEFCFECGSIQCHCSHDGTTYDAGEEPIRDGNGIVNIRACMHRRDGRDVRRERALQRYEIMAEEENRWTYTYTNGRDNNFDYNSCDGKWLFSRRKGSKSLVVLMQQYELNSSSFRQRRHEKRQAKQQQRYQTSNEEENRWMSTHERARILHYHDDNSAFAYNSCDGRWLFSCRNRSQSEMVLMQQCNSQGVRRQRYEREQLNQDIIPVQPSWLFENEGQDAQLQALHLHYEALQPMMHAMEQKKKEDAKTLSFFAGMMGHELLNYFGVVPNNSEL